MAIFFPSARNNSPGTFGFVQWPSHPMGVPPHIMCEGHALYFDKESIKESPCGYYSAGNALGLIKHLLYTRQDEDRVVVVVIAANETPYAVPTWVQLPANSVVRLLNETGHPWLMQYLLVALLFHKIRGDIQTSC